jgi:hypothetical protein
MKVVAVLENVELNDRCFWRPTQLRRCKNYDFITCGETRRL